MAINFKLLFQQTGKLVLFYIMELRGFYWNMPFNRKKIFSLKILPGYKIKYVGKGDISEIVYKQQVLVKLKKSFEYSTMQLFSTILNSGDVIIDVGANSGLYSIFYSKLVGENGEVHSFEPDRDTYRLLRENLELNNCDNVRTYNFALSNEECDIKMVPFNPEDIDIKLRNGDSFKYMQQVSSEFDEKSNIIKAVKLDDIEELKLKSKIDVIKIDVEGAELLVLQGAVNMILKHRPIIIFELFGKWTSRFNYRPYELLVFLNKLNYQMEEYELQQWIARPAN